MLIRLENIARYVCKCGPPPNLPVMEEHYHGVGDQILPCSRVVSEAARTGGVRGGRNLGLRQSARGVGL
jgi:hypothetical protein